MFKLVSVIIVGALIYVLLMYNNYLQDKAIDKPYIAKSNLFSNYNLPLRNSMFTGREELINKIEKSLYKNRVGVISQSIVGAGGIGKTQLAVEYAYRAVETEKYDSIIWIGAENENSINTSYANIADKLDINTHGLSSKDLRKVVHTNLALKYQGKQILFVLDNVSNKDNIKQYLCVSL